MKGPLAAAAEALRATRDADLRLAGDVILCAHGLHEAPGGHAEDLEAVLRRGDIAGDAAIVLEVGHASLPLAGMGSAIYQIHFRRPEGVTHELRTPPTTPHPALAAAEAALTLRAYNERLSHTHIEGIGPESVFIGQLHSGDFFNRFSNHSWLEGTRRYSPENSCEAVTEEMRALLRPIGERYGLLLEVELVKVRDGFRISSDHPVVEALQAACAAETGHRLPITGIRVVADAPLFDKVGGIPCLYHGLDGEGAHGDVESVAEAELARGARTYLRTMVNYLGVA
jgi:acetylornithine deacetylase/succinyl-diaminopimelate desuccinylase-like protein